MRVVSFVSLRLVNLKDGGSKLRPALTDRGQGFQMLTLFGSDAQALRSLKEDATAATRDLCLVSGCPNTPGDSLGRSARKKLFDNFWKLPDNSPRQESEILWFKRPGQTLRFVVRYDF